MWIFPSFGGFLFDLIKDGGGAQCELAAPHLCVILPAVLGRFPLGVIYVGVLVCMLYVVIEKVIGKSWQGYASDLRRLPIVAMGVYMCEGAFGCPRLPR